MTHDAPATSRAVVLGMACVFVWMCVPSAAPTRADEDDPGSGPLVAAFPGFDLPSDWQRRFWETPGVTEMLERSPDDLSRWIPRQAGLRFCRCPGCGASEALDPLTWSIAKPDSLECRLCQGTFPNEKIPARIAPAPGAPPAVPEERIAVQARVTHVYPYHTVEPERQRYPDERIYLAARIDHEKREFLARAALYAAARARTETAPSEKRRFARFAATIILRFSQVYPAYALHVDQPNRPRTFLTASLKPPYRPGFQVAKWSWTASENVPLNLLIAYSQIAGDDVWDDTAEALDEPQPHRAIERFFRSCAELIRYQPLDSSEAELHACRGLLAVAWVYHDSELRTLGIERLRHLLRNGFYYDGVWHEANPAAQRRIARFLEGWIAPFLSERPGADPATQPDQIEAELIHFLRVARDALTDDLMNPTADSAVELATWKPTQNEAIGRAPRLLGGAGICRLAVGTGKNALDLELLGQPEHRQGHAHRLALRLSIGGEPVLGDLDHLASVDTRGFSLASASHTGVLVNSQNQRESLDKLRQEQPGSDILLHGVDPDFQVIAYADRLAYPSHCQLYRRIVMAVGGESPYVVDLFDIEGGIQHDYVLNWARGSSAAWQGEVGPSRKLASLLPRGVRFLPDSRIDDGRWFLQSYGELRNLETRLAEQSTRFTLHEPGKPGVRVHTLSAFPVEAITGTSPSLGSPGKTHRAPADRPVLLLRRQNPDRDELRSRFVTVIEPVSTTGAAALNRAGRIDSPPGTLVVAVEKQTGLEYVYWSTRPGEPKTVQLLDGTALVTDCAAVLVRPDSLVAMGGTFALHAGRDVRLPASWGTIERAGYPNSDDPAARGWFETSTLLEQPESLPGRTLIIRHGDGTARAWTIASTQPLAGGTRILVREEPGFQIETHHQSARYDQFPGFERPAPHAFHIVRVGRSANSTGVNNGATPPGPQAANPGE